tara:strand:- start:2296 stop:2469 length:174 start_codon:yes stop_codon:yes gene_type:complete
MKIDKQTREYRQQQFEQINTEYSEYKPKIKIIKPNGETKWIDISENELSRILTILLK